MDEKASYYIPYVIEKTGRGERQYDIYSRLLEDRIIFIGTAIDDTVANAVMAQLLFLDKTGRNQDIKMYINSPGGSVTAGLAMYDTMQLISAPVATFAVGASSSFATILLAAGAPGRRYALPNATVHLHQPHNFGGGIQGQATDISIHAQYFQRQRERIEQILSRHTGKPLDEIRRDTERDLFLDAEEARDYGLVDEVVTADTEAPTAQAN